MRARPHRRSGSVLEQELARGFARIGASLREHDRAVLLGFFLSLLPIFPLVFVGLALGIFHKAMHSAGKISEFDYVLARRGLWLGAVNCALSLLIVVAVLHAASSVDVGQILQSPVHTLRDVIDAILGIFKPSNRGETTV